jgi:glycosyltransferase involved in cell wall biosynthesis
LLVIDNCSPKPAADVVTALLERHPGVNSRLVRNAVNVGVDANLLRCIELADTEWVWTLSDDDVVSPDAVSTILRTLRQAPDSTFISFALPGGERPADIATVGRPEFVRRIDSLRHLTLISNNIYNRPRVRNFVNVGHSYAYSNLGYLAVPLVALGRDGKALLSKDSLVTGHQDSADDDVRWSFIHFSMGIMTLLELPMDHETQRALSQKLNASFGAHEAVTLRLAANACATNDARRAVYLYNAYAYRTFYFNRSPIRALKVWAYRWLVRYPHFARWLVRRFLPYKAEWFDRMIRPERLDCL